MNKIIAKIKNEGNNMNMKSIFEGILVLILLPGLMRGMFYIGHVTGEVIAGWF